MHHEKARIRNRPIEEGTREAQDNRVNFNSNGKLQKYKKIMKMFDLKEEKRP